MQRIFSQILDTLNEKLQKDELLLTMSNQKTTSKFISLRIQELVDEFTNSEELALVSSELDSSLSCSDSKIKDLESKNEKLLMSL